MSSLHNVNKQLSFFKNINNQTSLFKKCQQTAVKSKLAMCLKSHKIQMYSLRKFKIQIWIQSWTWTTCPYSPQWVLHDTTIKSAADASSRGLTTGIPRPAGVGLRLIMVAMGGLQGFVDGSVQLWKRSAKNGVLSEDYHCDINAENFEEWLSSVLPNLPPNSVLVFDNASYHSKKVQYLSLYLQLAGKLI